VEDDNIDNNPAEIIPGEPATDITPTIEMEPELTRPPLPAKLESVCIVIWPPTLSAARPTKDE